MDRRAFITTGLSALTDLKKRPSDWPLYNYSLGRCYEIKGNIKEAMAAYRDAVENGSHTNASRKFRVMATERLTELEKLSKASAETEQK